MKLKDVDMRVSAFVGALRDRKTGLQKYCGICKTEQAMWQHKMKKGDKMAYLCFGCGDH